MLVIQHVQQLVVMEHWYLIIRKKNTIWAMYSAACMSNVDRPKQCEASVLYIYRESVHGQSEHQYFGIKARIWVGMYVQNMTYRSSWQWGWAGI